MAKSNGYVKSVAVGLALGSVAFAATQMMHKPKSAQLKRAAGKAMKAVGTVLETLQM
ncbi:MAG: hypothetical protein GX346_08590 [Clostridiales bacterium]|nr:hypothetical protein [Clostridiales bacterium]